MAKPTEDEVAQYAFFLALEGLEDPPSSAAPRMFPPEIWTRSQIFNCLEYEFGRDAAKWALSMRLFTLH